MWRLFIYNIIMLLGAFFAGRGIVFYVDNNTAGTELIICGAILALTMIYLSIEEHANV